jgi:hypothetical protein
VEIGGGYGQGVVTFAVDAVEPVTDHLPAVRLDSLCPDALTVGGDPGRDVLAPDGVHPLLGAVGRAFAEHRPLVLSPDAVWLTIAQGLAPSTSACTPNRCGHSWSVTRAVGACW